jgi:aspartyl protease family protein
MNTELPRTLKVVTVWLLAGLALFMAIEGWQHRQAQTRFSAGAEAIEIRRDSDGHYHWPGRVNGRQVDLLIDTGATGTAIPLTLARELGLEALDSVLSSTAGGTVRGQVVRADIELRGGVSALRLRVVALPGLVENPLLGMDVLGRLAWRQEDGLLRIEAGVR